MSDILRWEPVISKAIAKYARGSSREDKQDMTQECYLKILEVQGSLESVADQEQERFIYVICRNRLLDIARESGRKIKEESLNDPGVRASSVFRVEADESNVTSERLEEAVQQLPQPQQYLITSSFFLKKTEKEIAQSLGKSTATVKRVKKAALVELRARLSEGEPNGR